MLTKAKKLKLLNALKAYSRKFLKPTIEDLDESGTRLMINSLLTDVLGFAPIDEIKTEYMIRGTYADYVIQSKGDRHFLVEVKSLSINLSEKHLRQAINYGANEGIEWALLTNGKKIDFYRILFEKPINKRLVFSIDLSDIKNIKNSIDAIQYIHRDSVLNKGLDKLWEKTVALDPKNVSGLLYTKPVINFIRRTLNRKSNTKFTETEIENAINRIIHEQIQLDDVKHVKIRKQKKTQSKTLQINEPISQSTFNTGNTAASEQLPQS